MVGHGQVRGRSERTIFFGVVYTFLLRFLPPPRRRRTRCKVDSFWML